MNKTELMLLDWMRKVHQLEYAHCSQSIYFSTLEKIVGITAFVFATVVAFIYRFPFINYPWVKEYFLPLMAFIAAILTAYQSFIKPGEKAETHRKLGLEYEKIRHEFESLFISAPQDSDISTKIKIVKEKWDSLNTLYVKPKYYDAAKKKVKSFNKYPKELNFILDST